MNTHTPGPWTRAQYGNLDRWAVMASGQTIAELDSELSNFLRNDHETRDANARLMAAAPELLTALESLLTAATGELPETWVCFEMARDAIAKATGKP